MSTSTIRIHYVTRTLLLTVFLFIGSTSFALVQHNFASHFFEIVDGDKQLLAEKAVLASNRNVYTFESANTTIPEFDANTLHSAESNVNKKASKFAETVKDSSITFIDYSASGAMMGTVSIIPANVSSNEQNHELVFIAIYTGPDVPGGFTIDFATSNGTATAGTDYMATSGTITFPTGTNGENVRIEIPLLNDALIESDETFIITLSNPSKSGITIPGNTGIGTILDNDGSAPGNGISFQNLEVIVTEGRDPFARFAVRFDGNIVAGEDITVDYVTQNGTALDGSDFTAQAKTLTFNRANKTRNIDIPILDDTIIEVAEKFTVILSNIRSNVGVGFKDGAADTAMGTILDDDKAAPGDGIAFTNTAVSELEGDVAADNKQLSFEVTYKGFIPNSATVSVDYATRIGSAIADDFTMINGSIDFMNSSKTQTIIVDVTEDTDIEIDENFTLELSNLTATKGFETGFIDGASTNTATGTILNDDISKITVESYDETLTIMCGEEIPESPKLVISGGCGDYDIEFNEVESAIADSDDFLIVRTWDVTDKCGNTATFKQVITVTQRKEAMIEFDICIADEAKNLLDLLPAGFDKNGTFKVTQGNATIEDGKFDPKELALGEYLVTYESMVGSCTYLAKFSITVNNDCLPCNVDDLVVSKTITVNGDGINDFFKITGLEDCRFTYNVKIFNRWGTMVYESLAYKNNWGGNASSASFGTNSVVPTGTYYYIITLSDSTIKPVNGYIYIGSN